ncbi:MAG: ribonuclease domain-containing protein [Aerococcus sp.]|nr:ribonuclease domain-containing protein [Aerococcus sp.]
MTYPQKQPKRAKLKKVLHLVLGLIIVGAVVFFANDDLVTPVTTAPDNGILSESQTDLTSNEQEAMTHSEEQVKKGQVYRSLVDVAAYLHRYQTLPPNYITKAQAKSAGWEGGDLWTYTDKKTIGGDHFGNYEATLPPGDYFEADVNYYGGKRNDDRLVYDKKGNIYFSDDHYNTFKKIY